MADGYDISTMPGWERNYFLRWVFKATEEYFKDPDVQRRFEIFMEEKRRKAAEKAAAEAAASEEAVSDVGA